MATVQEVINASLDRTDEAVRDANRFVDRLSDIANTTYNWDLPNVNFTGLNLGNAYSSIYSGAKTDHSTVSGVDLNRAHAIGGLMAMPSQVSDADLNRESISSFNFSPVELNIPDRPDFVSPVPPTGEVNISDVSVEIGVKPDAVMSVAHEEPAIPNPEAIDIGGFLIPAPEVDYLVPSNDFSFVENEYSSEFRDSIILALKDDIENGGSGINIADEQALFERARDRESATYKDTLPAISRQFAARGFKIPTGAMIGLASKARDTLNSAVSSINRDIMLQRSDLHVKARQFAIQAGTTLDNAMLSYHGSVMERAMNVARFTAQFGIDYHNMQVKAFSDRLQQWQTHSAVRTQWVDNAIKKTREYELTLQKMDLVDKRNARRTELMNAMNSAVKTAEDIRRTELEIGKFQIENNKLKLEQSKLLTQNYAEIMRSNDAAARAYGETIKAESLRNEPFKLNLEAHKAERDTALAKTRMQSEYKNTEIDVANANLAQFDARLKQYSLELDMAVNKANDLSKRLGLDLEGWKAHLLANDKSTDFMLNVAKTEKSLEIETKKVNLQSYKLNNDTLELTTNLTMAAANSGVGLYESLITGAQAALGTISVLTEDVSE